MWLFYLLEIWGLHDLLFLFSSSLKGLLWSPLRWQLCLGKISSQFLISTQDVQFKGHTGYHWRESDFYNWWGSPDENYINLQVHLTLLSVCTLGYLVVLRIYSSNNLVEFLFEKIAWVQSVKPVLFVHTTSQVAFFCPIKCWVSDGL